MATRPKAQTSKPWPAAPAALHESIRRRAEEVYIRNGRIPGHDLENWAQAEQEILSESADHAPHSSQRTAIVVTVDGVKYIGEYDSTSSEGYAPGEFVRGKPVRVRFDGDKMFVKRPNGKELETTVVSKAD